jgi:hypothetical protein
MKVGPPIRERARVLMHLNGGMTKISLERTEGLGLANGGVTWDVPTNDIPMHLRPIGSRFVIVAATLRPEAGDSTEVIRQASRPDVLIEELTEDDA